MNPEKYDVCTIGLMIGTRQQALPFYAISEKAKHNVRESKGGKTRIGKGTPDPSHCMINVSMNGKTF